MLRGPGPGLRGGGRHRARAGAPARGEVRSLLDVACGTGAHLRRFARRCPHVEGLELSPDMLTVARGHYRTSPCTRGTCARSGCRGGSTWSRACSARSGTWRTSPS
ncbi:class I SAM-dependent methyltransferase [Prauserella oleivorans]